MWGVLTLSKGRYDLAGGFDDSDTPGSESPRAAPRRSRAGRVRTRALRVKPSKSFTFDHMYDEYSTQEVYAQYIAPYIAPFTAKFLAGHTVTPFAASAKWAPRQDAHGRQVGRLAF